MKTAHQVIVGNIGTVYDGTNYMEARTTYCDYCRQARELYGRAAGETVTWCSNGEIHKEQLLVTYQVEVTDTFGGEANYSWVRRYSFAVPIDASRRQIIRKAKALAGWSGGRCKVEDMGDMFTLRPVGICQVMFITY